jgi:hypothetical protein
MSTVTGQTRIIHSPSTWIGILAAVYAITIPAYKQSALYSPLMWAAEIPSLQPTGETDLSMSPASLLIDLQYSSLPLQKPSAIVLASEHVQQQALILYHTHVHQRLNTRMYPTGQVPVAHPVILATWEAEVGRISI